MPLMILLLRPFIRERCVVYDASLCHNSHQTGNGGGGQIKNICVSHPNLTMTSGPFATLWE
jgi:hypothetical protein